MLDNVAQRFNSALGQYNGVVLGMVSTDKLLNNPLYHNFT